ncbi:hypothetical protein GCM10023220_62970 [Streptomyces ziwulingensis]|uniref:Uncharacterized protein n=1 Tax=Streptomyces ziwulingensis TaxID=1045501 RepID=A0ABP9D272_9ACTN
MPARAAPVDARDASAPAPLTPVGVAGTFTPAVPAAYRPASAPGAGGVPAPPDQAAQCGLCIASSRPFECIAVMIIRGSGLDVVSGHESGLPFDENEGREPF